MAKPKPLDNVVYTRIIILIHQKINKPQDILNHIKVNTSDLKIEELRNKFVYLSGSSKNKKRSSGYKFIEGTIKGMGRGKGTRAVYSIQYSELIRYILDIILEYYPNKETNKKIKKEIVKSFLVNELLKRYLDNIRIESLGRSISIKKLFTKFVYGVGSVADNTYNEFLLLERERHGGIKHIKFEDHKKLTQGMKAWFKFIMLCQFYFEEMHSDEFSDNARIQISGFMQQGSPINFWGSLNKNSEPSTYKKKSYIKP
jgi:hypothetical protein